MLENSQIFETNLPEIEKVKFKRIHKNYLKVILLNIFLFCTLLITANILLFLFKDSLYTYIQPIYVYTSIFLFSLLLLLYYYIGFTKRKYAIRQKDISYKSGVFIKSTTTVPFNRIQHIEIDEGFFSRFFKLASINIYTAGAEGKDLEIRGVSKENAFRIKEFITSIIYE